MQASDAGLNVKLEFNRRVLGAAIDAAKHLGGQRGKIEQRVISQVARVSPFGCPATIVGQSQAGRQVPLSGFVA